MFLFASSSCAISIILWASIIMAFNKTGVELSKSLIALVVIASFIPLVNTIIVLVLTIIILENIQK